MCKTVEVLQGYTQIHFKAKDKNSLLRFDPDCFACKLLAIKEVGGGTLSVHGVVFRWKIRESTVWKDIT